MNYRHIFHAGNFADLLKHAVLTDLLTDMTGDGLSLTVIDTHAGAGVYDLETDAAVRTGEAVSGVARRRAASAAPAVFDALKARVRELNAAGGRRYPGSPLLIAFALRPGDRLIACEARPDDFAILAAALKPWSAAKALCEDGWRVAAGRASRLPEQTLVLIDPPYELSGDGARAAEAAAAVLKRNREARIAVWAPIKDLTSFDRLLGDLEAAALGRRVLVIETRLTPLDEPLKLNGCAMIVINPSLGAEARARQAAEWIAQAVGGEGAAGRVWMSA